MVVALAGCGRVDFDPFGGAASDALATTDAVAIVSCPIGTSAPDPLVVSGTAFRATTGIHQAGVVVAAMLSPSGTPIAMMTTGANGSFSLSLATGDKPIAPYFSLTKSGFVTSVSVPDQPIDQNLTNLQGFMGMQSDVDGLYSAGGATQDMAQGTLFVTVVDCSGNAIAGATIATTPTAKIVYSGNLGVPSNSATSTGPSGWAWAINVPVGTIQLDAAKSGLVFPGHPVAILDGTHFMGTNIRPMP